MTDQDKKLPVRFYQIEPSGKIPVREWLMDFSSADKRTIGKDIKTAEYGWPVGMPLCRHLDDELWEIRSNISNGRITRIIFCVAGGHMVLLHGFIKKSDKTPRNDLALARQRMKDVLS